MPLHNANTFYSQQSEKVEAKTYPLYHFEILQKRQGKNFWAKEIPL